VLCVSCIHILSHKRLSHTAQVTYFLADAEYLRLQMCVKLAEAVEEHSNQLFEGRSLQYATALRIALPGFTG
jgi:hypothetical protein